MVTHKHKVARATSEFSSQAGKKIDSELIQALVGQPFPADGLCVENVGQQGRRALPRISSSLEKAIISASDLLEYGTDFFVRVPARRFLFQHQVGAHAAARKVFHTAVILGAIGMRIKMP